MHPIERLRYVARAEGIPQAELMRETASAMMSFAGDPAELLTACRRLVARQPESGLQVTLAASLVTAPDARRAAWDVVEAVDEDPTATTVVRALPDDATICVVGWPDVIGERLSRRGDLDVLLVESGHRDWQMADRLRDADVACTDIDTRAGATAARLADVTVVEAVAAGPEQALVRAGALGAAASAHAHGREVWLALPAGTVLPGKMWDGLLDRYTQQGEMWNLDWETMRVDLATKVFGPAGETDAGAVMRHAMCPVAPELFR